MAGDLTGMRKRELALAGQPFGSLFDTEQHLALEEEAAWLQKKSADPSAGRG
jgi:hypothetical protein